MKPTNSQYDSTVELVSNLPQTGSESMELLFIAAFLLAVGGIIMRIKRGSYE